MDYSLVQRKNSSTRPTLLSLSDYYYYYFPTTRVGRVSGILCADWRQARKPEHTYLWRRIKFSRWMMKSHSVGNLKIDWTDGWCRFASPPWRCFQLYFYSLELILTPSPVIPSPTGKHSFYRLIIISVRSSQAQQPLPIFNGDYDGKWFCLLQIFWLICQLISFGVHEMEVTRRTSWKLVFTEKLTSTRVWYFSI